MNAFHKQTPQLCLAHACAQVHPHSRFIIKTQAKRTSQTVHWNSQKINLRKNSKNAKGKRKIVL